MPLHPPTHTEREEGAPWVFVDRDHVAPRRFTATIHFVGGRLRRTTQLPRDRFVGAGGVTGVGGVQVVMDVEVQGDWGAPRCLRLEIKPEPPENEPLTATAVRVPIDRLMRYAVTDAMRVPGPELPNGERWAISPGLQEREDFHDNYRQGSRRPRGPFTDQELENVAAIYREAASIPEGRAKPKVAVAESLYVSWSTAGRMITAAREAGHLPPARPGRVTY